MFTYENQEWDNVPSVIPKYLIHLEEFVCMSSKIQGDLESTEHLRSEMEKKLEIMDEKADEIRGID